MTYIPKDKVYIPPEWTGKQALNIWEFIEEIAMTIWDVHEDKILEAQNLIDVISEIKEPDDNDRYAEEDDIPF